MSHTAVVVNHKVEYKVDCSTAKSIDIPAWSLHRLIEMMPRFITYDLGAWFYMSHDDVLYTDLDCVTKDFSRRSGIYYNVISAIEWLIKEGYFNKEYLED